MTKTAILRILLMADDALVAESDDKLLWQKVLAEMHGVTAMPPAVPPPSNRLETPKAQHSDDAVGALADLLQVTPEVVEGALSPSRDAPYLTLNARYWEPFRKALPQRGIGSVAPIAFAGTALALWLREAGLGVQATQGLSAQILDTIGLRDPNPSRGVKNTDWLQARAGGVIIINPAEASRAIDIVRAYCLKKAPSAE